MSRKGDLMQAERVRVALWQDALIRHLKADLRRCIEYIHDGTEDGLTAIHTIAKQAGASSLILTAITVYYQRLTDDGHQPVNGRLTDAEVYRAAETIREGTP